ncbi:hypothetical protein BDR26DRAFT_868077 [Obelidium mucronatum]|nr:hypothetical protein BDR26DRAFT_868077 [Obelidium mucronatum]
MMQNIIDGRDDQPRKDKGKSRATEEAGNQSIEPSSSNSANRGDGLNEKAADSLPQEQEALRLVILIDMENMPAPKSLTPEKHLEALKEYFTRAGPAEEASRPRREVARILAGRGFQSVTAAGSSQQLFDAYRQAGAEGYTNYVDDPEAARILLSGQLKKITLSHVEDLHLRQPLLIVVLSNDSGFAGTFAACIREGHQVVVVHDEHYSLDSFYSVAPHEMRPPLRIPHEAILRQKFPQDFPTSSTAYILPDHVPQLVTPPLSVPPTPIHSSGPPGTTVQEERNAARDFMTQRLQELGWL